MTLSNERRDRLKDAFVPVALAMGRAGLTPDALTVIGFLVTVVGAVLLSQQLWLAGGLVVFAGGVFDMFDGTLARATGQVSKLGAFMDSVFDKLGEIVVYLGILLGVQVSSLQLPVGDGFLHVLPILTATAMGSAFMVSYTRAKAEGLGFTSGSGMAAVGVMPREMRLIVLTVGLVLTGLAGGVCPFDCETFPQATPIGVYTDGAPFLAIAVGIITIGATITTIQRILHVRSQALQQSTSHPTETNT